jgi:hypothetical protein
MHCEKHLVAPFYSNVKDPVKVSFRCVMSLSDMRYSGAVDEDIKGFG